MPDNTQEGAQSTAILTNIAYLRQMISRIRNKEGGLGSNEDEMALYRTLSDIDTLVAALENLKSVYDQAIAQRDETIRELRSQTEAVPPENQDG